MRNKLGQFVKGFGFWTGKKRPNLRETNAVKTMFKKGENLNESNHAWKGDDVSYVTLHVWVKRKLGTPTKCSNNKNHQSKRYVWANISGEYKRDLNDWHQLCNSCNMKDGVHIHKRFKKTT